MESITLALLIAAGVYVLSFITWIFYLAVMNLIAHRDKLGRVAKAHAYLVIGIGLVIDALLNLVFSLLVFWDRPRAKLLTGAVRQMSSRMDAIERHISLLLPKSAL